MSSQKYDGMMGLIPVYIIENLDQCIYIDTVFLVSFLFEFFSCPNLFYFILFYFGRGWDYFPK